MKSSGLEKVPVTKSKYLRRKTTTNLFSYNHFLAVILVPFFIVLCNTVASETGTLLKEFKAECTREGINVKLWFEKPFAGVAYSHGHYETAKCRYIPHDELVRPSGTNFSFLIPMNGCGTIYYGGSSIKQKDTGADQTNGNEMYIENTLLIQKDATIQEEGDVAKTLRCVWQKEIHQPLTASLPIGIGKMSPLKSGNTQRVSTVVAKLNRTRGGVSRANDSKTSSHVNIRFQKKGQVQSVPVYPERRQYSRALDFSSPESQDEDIYQDDHNERSTGLVKVELQVQGGHEFKALPLNSLRNGASPLFNSYPFMYFKQQWIVIMSVVINNIMIRCTIGG